MDFMVSLRYIFTFVDAALINRCHTGTSRSEGSHQVYQANPKDAAIAGGENGPTRVVWAARVATKKCS